MSVIDAATQRYYLLHALERTARDRSSERLGHIVFLAGDSLDLSRVEDAQMTGKLKLARAIDATSLTIDSTRRPEDLLELLGLLDWEWTRCVFEYGANYRFGQLIASLAQEAGCEPIDLTDEEIYCLISERKAAEDRPVQQAADALSVPRS